VLSRSQLLDLAHRRDWEPFDRSIDIGVARLRKKIERDPAKPQIERATMSAALRETKTGPTFAETKLLAFLDAVPARVAFIDRDRRRRWGSAAVWAMRASPASLPGGPRKAIEGGGDVWQGERASKGSARMADYEALNLTRAFPIMAGGSCGELSALMIVSRKLLAAARRGDIARRRG